MSTSPSRSNKTSLTVSPSVRHTVKNTWSAKVTIFTPFCYRFIQVTAGKKLTYYDTGHQLD